MNLYGQNPQKRSVNIIESEKIDKISHSKKSYKSDTEGAQLEDSDIESEYDVPIRRKKSTNTQQRNRSRTPRPRMQRRLFNIVEKTPQYRNNQPIVFVEPPPIN